MQQKYQLEQGSRLRLVPSTLAHIEAELQGPEYLQPLLRVDIPQSWPPGEYDRDALLYFRSRMQEGGPSHDGWYGWYVIASGTDAEGESLVAAAGYFGPPADGCVEIGYSVVPEARGLRFASEIIEALVVHAFKHRDVQVVIAHTSDSNVPSTKALLRSGFVRVGPGTEAGTVQYRRLTRVEA